MKKSIELITIDVSLLDWMHGKLQISGFEASGKNELIEGLENLLAGTSSSLMIEADHLKSPVLQEDVIQHGNLSIAIRSRRVLQNGKEVSLTPKEFDILLFLARNCGEVFTKEQIYQAVWDDHYLLDDSNIMAFIRKLRKKIEPNPDSPQYILTIWGIGYKFNDKLE